MNSQVTSLNPSPVVVVGGGPADFTAKIDAMKEERKLAV